MFYGRGIYSMKIFKYEMEAQEIILRETTAGLILTAVSNVCSSIS
jgi:hypothetical protein